MRIILSEIEQITLSCNGKGCRTSVSLILDHLPCDLHCPVCKESWSSLIETLKTIRLSCCPT